MEATKSYENYPLKIVILSNLSTLAIYIIGFLIFFKFNFILSLLYILYVIALEVRLIKNHCVDCYYYGKTCGFGKGRVSALFFKEGNSKKFCANKMQWKDIVPDIMVWVVPLILGIVLLIKNFEIITLLMIVALILLSTMVTGYIRGNLSCKYCKQKELGCPAYLLFNKSQS